MCFRNRFEADLFLSKSSKTYNEAIQIIYFSYILFEINWTRKILCIWMELCEIRLINGKALWYAWSFIAMSTCTFNAIWTRRRDLFRVGGNVRQEWISGSHLQKSLSLKIASRGRRTRLRRRGGDDYFPIRGKDVDDSALSLATAESLAYQFEKRSDFDQLPWPAFLRNSWGKCQSVKNLGKNSNVFFLYNIFCKEIVILCGENRSTHREWRYILDMITA